MAVAKNTTSHYYKINDEPLASHVPESDENWCKSLDNLALRSWQPSPWLQINVNLGSAMRWCWLLADRMKETSRHHTIWKDNQPSWTCSIHVDTEAPAAISNVKGFKNWRKVSNCETILSNSNRKDLNISIRAVTFELLYWIYWCSFAKLVPLIFHR